MMGIIGVLFHGRGQLFHTGGSLFNRSRLLLSTGREIGVTGGYLAGTTINLLCPLTHSAYGVDQRVLHGLQIAGETPNFAATGQIVRHRQIALRNLLDATRRALQWMNHGTAQHHEGHRSQHQRQCKRSNHKHQAELGTFMGVGRQRIGAVGTDLNRLQQNFIVAIVQRTGGFILMIDDGFKHTVFGIFQHRLQPGDISIKARFQFAIQRFVSRCTHRAIHVRREAFLRLLDTRFGF
ncbi:hypothetical protein D3C71_814550 [compost metagenome]